MKKLTFVGALACAFALGGITTLLGVPRNSPTNLTSVVSISPEDLTRSAGPLVEQIVENYL
jgi:hypothetical protein